MNPGPVEEAGKAVGSFMDSMKAQPLSLALVVMNVCLLGMFYLILEKVSEARAREFLAIQNEQKEVRDLLARCVVQPRADLGTKEIKDTHTNAE
jgi:hypothetical protein